MTQVDERIYRKITKLTNEVKTKLYRKGLVIPSKNLDGTISVGKYIITKTSDTYFQILEKNGDVLVDNINLPQTAAIVANSLALGQKVNKEILLKDQTYGSAVFEELLYNHRIENSKEDDDRLQTMLIKKESNLQKKEVCKREIEESFQKLMRIV